MNKADRQRIDAKVKKAIRAYRRRFQCTNWLRDNIFWHANGDLCVRIRDGVTGHMAEYSISGPRIKFMPTH